MKRLARLSIGALTLSAVYLYAWPAPNLFYAAAVLFHVGLGVVFSVAGLFLLRHALRGPVLVKLGTVVLAAGSALGLALIYTGTSRVHWNLMYAHIAASALAVVLLGTWLFSRGKVPARNVVGSDGCRGGHCRHPCSRSVLRAKLLEQAVRHQKP